jgi:hypothetical protein
VDLVLTFLLALISSLDLFSTNKISGLTYPLLHSLLGLTTLYIFQSWSYSSTLSLRDDILRKNYEYRTNVLISI